VSSMTATVRRMSPRQIAVWTAVAILGAVAWGIIALVRGERINAVWLIFAARAHNGGQAGPIGEE